MSFPPISNASIPHPTQLAGFARLFGLHTPDIQHSRILVVGFNMSETLINIALALPQAQCVGVEFAKAELTRCQTYLAHRPQHNLQLLPKWLPTTEQAAGQTDEKQLSRPLQQHFDYILLVDTYHQLSIQQNEMLLNFCQHHLTTSGLLYLRHAIQPGWQLRTQFQQLLNNTPEHSQTILQNLIQATPGNTYQSRDHLDKEQRWLEQLLASATDTPQSLRDFHEMPLHIPHFQAFYQDIKKQGWFYLGDCQADTQSLLLSDHEAAENAQLAQMCYHDLVAHRDVRESLLCKNVPAATQSTPLDQQLQDCFFRFPLQCLSEQPGLHHPGLTVRFADEHNEQMLEETVPLAKTLLWCLSQQWPQSLGFNEICAQTCAYLQEQTANQLQLCPTDATVMQEISGHLQRLSSGHFLEIHIGQLPLSGQVYERPQGSPLAQWQFQENKGQASVQNLYNQKIRLDMLLGNLFLHLDGQHTRQELLGLLRSWVEQGYLAPNGASPDNVSDDMLLDLLDNSLNQLAGKGLLLHNSG
ncbi:hypothetical protein QUF61_14440 [Candidatus Venteria ishoeyi]|uniref:hypothetical protein n=1 Tax=Candidatus Venteria ishoeyi TaxID=1899563 RepID=UPI0025A60243|nr:hypothetical protein [Candidatus Venteria ishoeyi]MDM8547687.1 hypothetical protein [Candidatus Venteria ishoeyi]